VTFRAIGAYRFAVARCARLVLDEPPSGESRLDVVPVADAVALAELPAEQDLASAPHRGEIDETLVGVLHIDAETRDLEEERVDLLRDRVGRAAIVRRFAPLEILEERTNFGEDGLGLSPCERRHMLAAEYGTGGSAVATYVLLTKVTAAGVKTLQSNPRRIKEVNKEIEALGARVVAQYATLGRYDFVNIVEAKDNETIARVSVGLGARGTVQIETLTAIPVETFIRTIGRKTK
jgi:uncharacterized protein with GYD domain